MPAVLDSVTLTGRRLLAVGRSGLIDVRDPKGLVTVAKEARARGPLAGTVVGAAARFGDRPIFTDDHGTLTARQLDERSNALARWLTDDGVRPGDGIAILCRNHRGLLDAMFAASKVGARLILMNTGFAGPQLEELCRREQVTTFLVDQEFDDRVPAFVPRHVCTWSQAGSPSRAPQTVDEIAGATSTAPVDVPAKLPSTVILTSGTTGTPKGAPRDEVSALAALGPILDRIPFRANQCTYVGPPMFHSLGLVAMTLSLSLGCHVVTNSRFDAERTLETFARHGVTAAVVVPAMLQRMFDLGPGAVGGHDLSALRIVWCAGSQLPGAVAEQVLETWGDVLYVLYGSTECAMASISVPTDHRAAPTTVGRPTLGATVKIFDEEGRELPAGQTGTIYVSNGVQFKGYTDGTGKRIIDGLMSSGDVGHFDQAGRLFIDGRDDDMIVSGGENVFPQEVEELLIRHDDVLDAAVLGVEDQDWGKRLAAFVVVRPDASLTEDDVQAYVKANLANYKVPREVVFLDELPRNPTGKVLKRVLRDHPATAR